VYILLKTNNMSLSLLKQEFLNIESQLSKPRLAKKKRQALMKRQIDLAVEINTSRNRSRSKSPKRSRKRSRSPKRSGGSRSRSQKRSRNRTITRGGGKDTANVIFQSDKEIVSVMHMEDSGDRAGEIVLDHLRNYGYKRSHNYTYTPIPHIDPSIMGKLMCILFNDKGVGTMYPVNPNGNLPVADYTYKLFFIRDELWLTVTHANKKIFDGVVGPETLSELRRVQNLDTKRQRVE
jgi:hypothetical protein